MRSALNHLSEAGLAFWRRLREWCGDAAYERYLQAAARHSCEPIATPGQFYLQQLERKYSKPNRCC